MNRLKTVLTLAAFLCFSYTASQAATQPTPLKNVRFSFGGGFNWANSNKNNLYISPFETDLNRIKQISNNGIWKLGIGYPLFGNILQNNSFFINLLLELNFYHSSATIKGDVWQYHLPQFNNYNFRAPVISNRFMLDFKPTLFSFHSIISPYAIFGAGVAWNTMSYSQTVTGIGVDPNSYVSLGKHRNTNIAYDLGFGINSEINNHLSTSVEYIYTNLGKVSPSTISKGSTSIMRAPTFNLYNQSVLFSLNWKI